MTRLNSGKHCQSFWFGKSGLGPENGHFWHVPRWGRCCWCSGHTVTARSEAVAELSLVTLAHRALQGQG